MVKTSTVKTINNENADTGNAGSRVDNANRSIPGVSGALGSLSVLMALEPRFMFDAAVVAEAVEVVSMADSHADVDAGVGPDGDDAGHSGESESDSFSNDQEQTFAQPLAYSPYSGIMPMSGIGAPNEQPTLNTDNANVVGSEDNELNITGIIVGDPEGDTLNVTLDLGTDENGKLFLDLAFDSGVSIDESMSEGNSDHGYSKITLVGEASLINKALEKLRYEPVKDSFNADENGDYLEGKDKITLAITVHESDPSKAGWHDAATASLDILIKSVNDEPVISGIPAAGWEVQEDTPLTFDNDIFTITDVDGDNLTVRFEVGNGKLSFDGFSKETDIDTDGQTYWEFSGTQDEIKELIGSMTYQGKKDYSGSDTMKITVDDGNVSTPVVKNVFIDINAVDDPPIWHHDLDQDLEVDEGGATVLTEDHINITDVDSDDNQITIKITEDFDTEKGVVQMQFGTEWVTLGKNSTFTYQDLKDGRIRYLHSGAQVRDIFSGSTSDAIHFSIDKLSKLVDGKEVEIAGGNFEIKVKLLPVNQDPEINEDSNTNVVYEGQGGVKITFEIDDPDQEEGVGQIVQITDLPTDGDLYYKRLYYKDGATPEDPKIAVEEWVKITQELIDDGFTLDMLRVNAGYLLYYHNGLDGERVGQGFGGTRPDSFKIVVTDDGGGTEIPSTTGKLTVNLDVRASNDLPIFDGTPDENNLYGTDTVHGWHTTGQYGNGGNELVLGRDILADVFKTKDDDSMPGSITYTLLGNSSYKGKLYYRTGTDGNYSYREITANSSFTQADIDAGRIVYCYYGGYGKAIEFDQQGNPTKYHHDGEDIFKFTIRDSSVSVIDQDGYYHEGGFEGGVGQWIGREIVGGEVVGGTLIPGATYAEGALIPAHWENGIWVEARKAGPGGETLGDFYTGGQWVGGTYNQGTGEQWVLTEIAVEIKVDFQHGTGGEGHVPPPSVGVGEIKFGGDQRAVVYEDGEITLSEDDLHAWMKYPLTNEDGSHHSWLEEEELSLTFRIANEASNGYLIFKEYVVDEHGEPVLGMDGKVHFTGKEVVLLNNDSFTMRDITLGAIVYRHDGGEALTDSLSFTISDGTVEYKDTGGLVYFKVNVIPVNDTPVVGGELVVKEGPTDEQRASGEENFGNWGVTIGLDHLGDLYDADGDRTGKTEDNPIDNSNAMYKDDPFAQANEDKRFVFIKNPNEIGDIYIYDESYNDPLFGHWRVINYATEADARNNPDWSSANLNGADVVTIAQIEAGLVKYIHSGKEVFNDEIYVMVNDGMGIPDNPAELSEDHPYNSATIKGKHGSSISELGKIIVTITPVNDMVVIDPAASNEITVDFGSTTVVTPDQYETLHGSLDGVRITSAMLSYTDIDATDKDGNFDPAQIRYKITEAPKYGTIYHKVNNVWIAARIDTVFSQKDINDGNVVYIHNGIENNGSGTGNFSQHADSFTYEVYDGDQAKKVVDQTFEININMHNEAPILEEATRNKNYYVDDENGMSFDGLFNLDDPDYYSRPDVSDGIGNDYMQITLRAEYANALWGYFALDTTGLSTLKVVYPAPSSSDSTIGMLVIRGSKADLQAALDRVVFLPQMGKDGTTVDLNQSVKIIMTLNDLANGDAMSKNADYDAIGGYTTQQINDYFGYYDSANTNSRAKETTTAITVHVSPVNNDPVFENTDDSSGVPGQKGSITKDEDSPAFLVVDHENKALQIHDPDEFRRNINEIAITCSENGVLNFTGSLSGVKVMERGLVFNATTQKYEYVIVLRGSMDNINKALETLTYKSNKNFVGDDTVTLKYNDGYDETTQSGHYTEWGTGKGGILTCQSTVDITILAVNDAPEIKGSEDVLRTEERTTIPVKWGENTYLTVGDPDDDPNEGGWWHDDILTVTIVANQYDVNGNVIGTFGTLQVDAALFGGLIQNAGNGTDTLVLKGTIAQLNAALKTLEYSQNGGSNSNIHVKLDVEVNDHGNGSHTQGQNPLTDSFQVTIIVDDKNDLPTIAAPTQTVDMVEDADKAFLFDSNSGFLSVNDIDAFDNRITVELTVEHGVLSFLGAKSTYGFTNYDTFTIVTKDGKTTVTLRASQDKINAALAQLQYKANANWYGTDTLTVKTHDAGTPGAEASVDLSQPLDEQDPTTHKYTMEKVLINIAPQNDKPKADSPAVKVEMDSITEDTTYTDTAADGQSVYDLFKDRFSDSTDLGNNNTTPVDNAFIGVWVSSANSVNQNANGSWQYLDTSGNWQDIKVNMFLRMDSKIRFKPADNFNSETESGSGKYLGTVPDLTVKLVESSQVKSNYDDSMENLDLDALCILVDATGNEIGKLTTGTTYTAAQLKRDGQNRYTDDNLKVTILVKAVNDTPTISYPDTADGNTTSNPIHINEDATTDADVIIFKNGNGNAIVFADVDFNERVDGNVTVTLTVEHGILTLGSKPAGLNASATSGKSLTLTGTIADINAAVEGLKYKGDAQYNGKDALVISINDHGYSHEKGQASPDLTANKTIHIFVDQVNDAPTSSSTNVVAETIHEDISGIDNVGKSVDYYFGNLFGDIKDAQYNDPNNLDGSKANGFIGVWVREGQTQQTSKGVWQYFDTTEVNPDLAWKEIVGGMFLSKDTIIRFAPAQDYNSEVHDATGAVKNDAPKLVVSLVESKDEAAASTCDLITKNDVIYTESDLTYLGGPRFSTKINLSITVTARNDDPAISYPAGTAGESKTNPIEVNEEASKNIGTNISFADVDVGERKGGNVTVTLEVGHGTLDLGTIPSTVDVTYSNGKATVVITGTLGDVNALIKNLTYKGVEDFNGEDILKVSISDNYYSNSPSDLNPHEGTDTKNLYLKVLNVNDAPVSKSGTVVAEKIHEDTTDDGQADADNTGKTVDYYFSKLFDDSKDAQYNATTNPTGSKANNFLGIWVRSSQTEQATKGTWTYFDTSTNDWVEITNGMFLSKDTIIRFEPVLHYNSEVHNTSGVAKNDSPTLTVKLVESESGGLAPVTGTVYSQTDLTHTDGSARYSGDVKLSITVTAVNTDPVIDYASGQPGESSTNPIEVNEEASKNIGTHISFDDIDVAERKGATVTVTLEVGHGTLDLGTIPGSVDVTYSNGKATVVIKGTLGDVNALIKNLTYKGANDFNGADTLKVSISDNYNSNSPSESNPYEGTSTKNVHIRVLNINDAPVSKSETVVAEKIHEDTTDDGQADADNTGKSVDYYFGKHFDDSKDAQFNATKNPTGSKANDFLGIWVRSDQTEQATKGTWTYFDTSLNDWVEITNGMFLSKDTLIRFEPVLHYNSEVHNASGVAKNDAPTLTVKLVESESGGLNPVTGTVYSQTDLTHADGSARYSGDVKLSITVTAVNTDPVIGYTPGQAGESTVNPIKINEDTSKNIGSELSFDDIDVGERKGATVSVTLEVGHGTLDLGSVPGTVDVTYSKNGAKVVVTGTLGDVNTIIKNLTYTGVKDYNGVDTLKVTISDKFNSNSPSNPNQHEGKATLNVHIMVDPVNDKPVISNPDKAEVNEDGTLLLPGISITDVDITDKSGTNKISVELSVGHGGLNVVGNYGNAIITANGSNSITITGTLKNVNSALAGLQYAPDANWNGSDALTINATDSGLNGVSGTSLSADTKVVPITVHPINDAPVINSGKGNVAMTDIPEDVSIDANPGESISGLFGQSFNDSADSVSGGSNANAFAGVVVVGVKGTAYGRWEFNTGSGWQVMPTNCSDANGFFLDVNAQVRFIPNADYNGSEPKLHVRLVDTSGTDSGRNPGNPELPVSGSGNVNLVGKTGGTFRYSADTVILTQKVVSVNDSPVVNGAIAGGEVINKTLGEEGRIGGNSPITTAGRTVEDLFGSYYQDERDGQKTSSNQNGSERNSLAGVLITEINDSSHGKWYYSDDGGVNKTEIVLEAGKGLLLSKDTLLFFVPEEEAKGEGAHSLVGRLVDNSAAFAHETQIDIPATDNLTDEFSEGSIRIKTYILGVNTAPIITVDETPTATERGPMIQLTPGGTVYDIDLENIDWRGATLVIERESGPSPIDIFGSYNSGVLGKLTEGGSVVVNGQNIGTVTKNSDGTLALTFNATATEALVNNVLNSIGYQYDSHVNAESVTLRYTVNDANGPGYGRQGTGGSLIHSTTQVVIINAINEDPVALDDSGSIILSPEFNGGHNGNVLVNDYDPDGTDVYVVSPTVIQGKYGSVSIDAQGNYRYTVNPELARSLAPGAHFTESFVYTIRDGNNGAPQNANLVFDIIHNNVENVIEPEAPKEIATEPNNPFNPKDGSLGNVPTPVQNEVNNARESTTQNINNVVDALDKSVHEASNHTDPVYDLDHLIWSEDIYLRSHPDSRNIYHNHMQEFTLPDTMFEHSRQGEVLEYEAVMADGSPLPEWILFDKERKCFTCQPPLDLEGVFELVVLAKDSQNHFAKANISIMVRPPEEMANANGFRDPDQIHKLGEEPGQEIEEKETAAEGEVVEEDVAAEALDEETARLLKELLEESEPGETENASQPDTADFTTHVARVSNTGLWLRTLELVENVKTL